MVHSETRLPRREFTSPSPSASTVRDVTHTGDPEPPADGTGSEPGGREHSVRIWRTFTAFLRLGLTSFGGPVAHLAYFREAFVVKRRWISEHDYADLVALAQFLPGPTSSQVGMAIGLHRAGPWGLAAAWVAFTIPSAALLVAFAYGAPSITDAVGSGWISGIKAAAVAVVAHAVISMARTLTPDPPRILLAVAATALVLLVPHPLTQVGVIVGAGILGILTLKAPEKQPAPARHEHAPLKRRTGAILLAAFVALLAALPVLATLIGGAALNLIDTFYRAGALVFGGGHVVLPLLHAEAVPTLTDNTTFLAGYGAAQAVPGPLFTFAAYLGTVGSSEPNGLLGAGIALLAIFAPAALLIAGAIPFWERLRRLPRARRFVTGVNAGVVGILAAALYNPVFTTGIVDPGTLIIALVALALITLIRVPAWAVVIGAALAGALLA